MSEPEGTTPSADSIWDRERGPSLLRAIWRYRYAILVVALLSGAVGYVRESRKPPVYEAASNIQLLNPYDRTLFRQERGTAFTDLVRYLGSQADLVMSPDVMARASELLHGELRPPQIRQIVTAQSSTTVYEITVRGRAGDPAVVASVVNAVTEAYQDVAEERVKATEVASVAQLKKLEAEFQQRLDALPAGGGDSTVESQRTGLAAQIATLQARQGQIRADAVVYGAGIDRIDKARPPEYPISDTPRRSAIIFGLLGLIAALIAAFWRSERVRVVDSGEDAAGAVGAPLLGVLPRHPTDSAPAAAPVLLAPASPAAREYEFIASALSLAARDSERRLVLVTSLEAGEAKSVTALNLALSAAQDQRSVVLLDVEPAGMLTGLLRGNGLRGASDLVALSAAGFGFGLRDGSTSPIDGADSFHFVPGGTRESKGRDTAESTQMAKVLVQLQQETDLVFVDGPALRESPGGIKLAAAVDGVILVVPRGTKVDQLRQAGALLATARAPIVGVVFGRSRSAGWWRPSRRPRRREPERRRRSRA